MSFIKYGLTSLKFSVLLVLYTDIFILLKKIFKELFFGPCIPPIVFGNTPTLVNSQLSTSLKSSRFHLYFGLSKRKFKGFRELLSYPGCGVVFTCCLMRCLTEQHHLSSASHVWHVILYLSCSFSSNFCYLWAKCCTSQRLRCVNTEHLKWVHLNTLNPKQ